MRHRATYTRHAGVSYFFGAYNVHEDHLWMHHKRKKHASVVLAFLKAIRRRYRKAKRIYLVLDNLSTHTTEKIGDGVSEIRSSWSSPRPTPPGGIVWNAI